MERARRACARLLASGIPGFFQAVSYYSPVGAQGRTMMRNTIVALVIGLAFVAGEPDAATPKPLPADVGPGRVAWFDISTTNLARSREFYGKLFDWKFAPVEGTDQAAEIVAGGKPIGTLRVADGAISAFNGVVYIQVADIRASCSKARELGGTVVDGFPFNLPGGIGAIALVIDPAGHPVGMYSRTPLPPDTQPVR
jgi:predicted enzyme related to lactoylglutathione lyase